MASLARCVLLTQQRRGHASRKDSNLLSLWMALPWPRGKGAWLGEGQSWGPKLNVTKSSH